MPGKVGSKVFTAELVEKVRKSKKGVVELAHIFGVGLTTIYDIWKGKTWPEVNPSIRIVKTDSEHEIHRCCFTNYDRITEIREGKYDL